MKTLSEKSEEEIREEKRKAWCKNKREEEKEKEEWRHNLTTDQFDALCDQAEEWHRGAKRPHIQVRVSLSNCFLFFSYNLGNNIFFEYNFQCVSFSNCFFGKKGILKAILILL